MLKTILPLLLFAGLVTAQDKTGCSSCGGCSEADPAKVLVSDLTAARKDLSDAQLEESKLPAEKLAEVRNARAHLVKETAVGKATMSAMVVTTLRLEEAAKSENKKSAKLAGEMAKSYRAVVLTLDGKAFDGLDTETAQARADEALKALEKRSSPTAEEKERLVKASKLLEESCPIYREVGNCWELMGDGLKLLASKCEKDDKSLGMVLKTNKRLAAAMSAGCSDCGSCGDDCTDCGDCEDSSGGCGSAKKADTKEAPKPKTQPPA
ncbi:MAG: hypothetical protein ACYTGV_04690 [Planctomycetota bacterium]|jgi:hypothetical protein